MTKIFTENDLVRFIYGETTKSETLAIQDAILCNPDMQDKYNELVELKFALDTQMVNPGNKVVDRILNYSRNFSDIHVYK